MSMKILVIGAGAIGAYYGARLAQAGADVSVVVRSDYDGLIEKGEYTIQSHQGDFSFKPSQILKTPGDFQGTADYVIVATKVLPGIDSRELLKDVVSDSTTIVLLQNGVEIEAPIQQAFPNTEIISGLCFICVNRVEPGVIDHQDYGHLVIGAYPQGKTERVQLLGDLFNRAGVQCEVSDHVQQARWVKLVWNAPYNPISVLAGGVDTQVIMANENAAKLVRDIMEEVYAVAKAVGAEFDYGVLQQNIDRTLKMCPYKPSMLLDYEAGREMEVESILGNAVKAARRVKAATPHMDSTYALLQLVNKVER
ncbi:2-dehydropantoate 2-reductase [Psychromonas aquimarina]|uniref:2-dehydropantoate 2-reductase n=1 Tax=Psychromonas aquimarina TaxID=444919 RepID=UPI00042729AE|nr:2-dehydropantoate 2-reductase [Psychromonas aquimarina]